NTYTGSIPTSAMIVDLHGLMTDVAPERRADVLDLVGATARMCIPQLYPDAYPPIDVSLMRRADADSSIPSLVFFDTRASNSGSLKALHGEGLSWVLRLMRLVLERVLHHGRILQRYNDQWRD